MASIQGIYIALFGRPADPLGLEYFNGVTGNGADLAAISDLAATAEYQDRFEGMSNVQIINSIYQSLFGRDADLAGLTFFAQALQDGTFNINNIAIAILDGAKGDDLATVNNKIEAANQFTESLDTGTEVAAYAGADAAVAGRAYLSGVTADEDTIPTQAETDASISAIVSGTGTGGDGEIFTLLAPVTGNANAGIDNVTGTSGDDTFRALAADSLESADIVDGAGGFDTLNAVLGGGTVAPVLKSVERLNFDVTAASTFDGSASTGIEQIWATGDNGVGGAGQLLTVTNVTTAVTIGMANNSDGVTVEFEGVSGNDDTANLAVDGSGAGDRITVSAVENINIDVQSDSAMQLSANGAEAVTISGEGDLNLNVVGTNAGTAQSTLASLESIDAAALDGNLVFSEAVENDFSIVTGAGNDNVSVAAASIADEVTISTGAGNDTIDVNATVVQSVGADVVAVAGSAIITGGAGADNITLQAGGAAAEATVVFEGQSDSTYTNFDSISNFTSGTDTLDFSALNLGGDTDTVAAGTTTNTTIGQFAGGVENFFDVGGDTLAVATFTEGTNTYVFADVNGNGNFDAANDLVVQLTGSATIVADDINFA